MEAEAEADRIRQVGKAEADATRFKGEAEAAVLRMRADAYKEFGEAALMQVKGAHVAVVHRALEGG